MRARLDQLSAAQESQAPQKDEALRSLQAQLQTSQSKYDDLVTASTESQAKTANLQTLLNLKNQQLQKLGADYG